MVAGADEILGEVPPRLARTARPRTDPLEGLNARQREAVTAPDGPTLVLAGPGSGKTRVISARITHLVQNRQIEPEAIAAITFTRKAADEMAERVRESLGEDDGERVWVSTFHKLCGNLLRKDGDRVGLERNFRIAQTSDRYRLITEASREALGDDARAVKPRSALQKISEIKNQLQAPDDPKQWGTGQRADGMAQMAGLYQEKLGAENKVDFDDLMLWSIRLLHENPDVRAQAENDHPFLLVDEYQDTNMPQYVLIKQLSEDSRNLFVVGDPDQAIYEWRGASIENIMRFEEDFPGSHRIDLETTYRSTGNILEAAGALIEPNEARIERKLTTTQAPGEPITVHAARTPSEEARYAAGVAKPALEAGESVAVLYRTNAQARAMEDHFKRENVPYEIAGGESFYKRQEVIDGLCCLQMGIDPRADDEATQRFVRMPAGERISRNGAQKIEFCGSADESWYDRLLDAVGNHDLTSRDERAVMKRIDAIETLGTLSNQPAAEIIEAGLKLTGYTEALQESEEHEKLDKLDNIEELIQDAQESKTSTEKGLANAEVNKSFSDRCHEMQNAAEATEDGRTRAVTLSTLHAAKGREFDTVVLAGFDSHRIPHHRSVTSAADPKRAIEEERRLAYVGMTRARKELHISYPETLRVGKAIKRLKPSPFLASVPDRLLQSSHAKAPAAAPERVDLGRHGREPAHELASRANAPG